MGLPLRWKKGSDYYWSPTLCGGVTLDFHCHSHSLSPDSLHTDISLTAKFLLVLASIVIFGSKSRGTDYHTLLSDSSGSLQETQLQIKLRVRVRFSVRRVAYRQSVRLGNKPLEDHYQNYYFNWSLQGNSPYVTSSLKGRWVCLFTWPLLSVRVPHVACYWKCLLLHYI
jgi:hypothetical protein